MTRVCLGEKNTFKFEGGDSQVENIIFKSAALGSGASGKHVVEVSAVDANSEKVTAILCILNDQVCQSRVHGPYILGLVVSDYQVGLTDIFCGLINV